MTTMELKELLDLGFNKNEARVYLSLVKLGRCDAGILIKETKFHKNIVYDNLEKLIDKGLVSFVVEDGRKVFRVSQPNMLVAFFEDKQKELLEKKEKAEVLALEIDRIQSKLPDVQEATIYRGIKGVKLFYGETLKIKNKEYVVFGAPKESVQIMGGDFWFNLNLKRKEKKIKVRMIFNFSLREYGQELVDRFTAVRYFDKDFEPLTETHVLDDKVAIIVWTEEPFLFLIKDKFVADSYMRFFEGMWKNAKS